jgi:hypothetical protein
LHRSDQNKLSKYMDAGRLAYIFLDDFLSLEPRVPGLPPSTTTAPVCSGNPHLMVIPDTASSFAINLSASARFVTSSLASSGSWLSARLSTSSATLARSSRTSRRYRRRQSSGARHYSTLRRSRSRSIAKLRSLLPNAIFASLYRRGTSTSQRKHRTHS